MRIILMSMWTSINITVLTKNKIPMEPVYNVMLIELQDGVEYRVGVGYIRRSIWEMAGPIRKKSKLG